MSEPAKLQGQGCGSRQVRAKGGSRAWDRFKPFNEILYRREKVSVIIDGRCGSVFGQRGYLQLGEIEGAFKTLKSDLHLRPTRHHDEPRIEAHILVCFLAYCLHVTLRNHLEGHAPGLTPREVLATLSGILMLDVHLPLADGRELVLPRYTQPEPEHRLVLEKLEWELPPQPPGTSSN